MTDPTSDRCPRCGGAFTCGIAAPAPCPCTTVTLAPEVLAQLRSQYQSCLCLDCLRELARPAQTAAQDNARP